MYFLDCFDSKNNLQHPPGVSTMLHDMSEDEVIINPFQFLDDNGELKW